MDKWATIGEVVDLARASMGPRLWDYLAGGAEGEVTLRRNRGSFEQIAFAPRILRGAATPDLSTSLLGRTLELPLLFAPVGSIAQFDPSGALAPARVAGRMGIGSFVGTLAAPSLEEVANEASCPLFFQMYMYGDRGWAAELVGRVEAAGYSALCLTADVAAYGRRERDLRNRFSPRDSVERPNLAALGGGPETVLDDRYNAEFTWSDLAWLRDVTSLPIMVKGVLSPEDAVLCADHGVEVVYVSNHGGRQLDHAPATIEVLPAIVEAVQGRAEVVIDSGFLRGTDVLKALALGAKAVGLGKLMAWGLAAGGQDGLATVVTILRSEMSTAMTNLGVASLAELSGAHVRPAVGQAAESWPGRDYVRAPL